MQYKHHLTSKARAHVNPAAHFRPEEFQTGRLRLGAHDSLAMKYQIYQTKNDLLHPLREAARFGAAWVRAWDLGCLTPPLFRVMGAAGEMFSEARLTHHRPDYGFTTVPVGNRTAVITEEATDDTPFGTLLHFRKDLAIEQPRVMLVAPMSGHFATLLRQTVRTMLPDHDLYITDWKNSRDIPPSAGEIGFDSSTEHFIRFQQAIVPGSHMVAVCQPTVAALAATAIMAEDRDPAQPRSLTLMAGPIDTRVNPTKVNMLARSQPIEWFEKEMMSIAPWR